MICVRGDKDVWHQVGSKDMYFVNTDTYVRLVMYMYGWFVEYTCTDIPTHTHTHTHTHRHTST